MGKLEVHHRCVRARLLCEGKLLCEEKFRAHLQENSDLRDWTDGDRLGILVTCDHIELADLRPAIESARKRGD